MVVMNVTTVAYFQYIKNEHITKTTGLSYRGYLLALNRQTGAGHRTGLSAYIFYFSRSIITGY